MTAGREIAASDTVPFIKRMIMDAIIDFIKALLVTIGIVMIVAGGCALYCIIFGYKSDIMQVREELDSIKIELKK